MIFRKKNLINKKRSLENCLMKRENGKSKEAAQTWKKVIGAFQEAISHI